MVKLSRDQLSDLFYSLDTFLHGPGTAGEKPGCDCGCGGDSIDWDQADEDRVEAEAKLAKLGIEYYG